MIRYLLLAMSIVLTTAAAAQKIPLIHSGEVITQATALYDSGKYEDAIAKFLTVPKRDTNYVYMLSELAMAYNANKQFDKAIATCEEALAVPSIYKAHLLRSQAVALDKRGDFEKSVALFKKAIALYPFDHSLQYNLGITYYNHKDYEKAIDCFFNVLAINPFHPGSHLNLGKIAVGQGRKTHAILSFGMYLGINNDDNSVLVYADKVLSNQVEDEGTLPVIGSNGCEKLDQILRAKLALDKNFKSKIDVDAAVVKQYEMFFEQLSIINTSGDDRWVNYYLPIYKTIKENNIVEPYMFHILASANNDVVRKWRKKNEKSLSTFYAAVNEQLRNKRAIADGSQVGFDKPIPAWFDDNYKLDALGVEQGEKRIGRWIYFHNNLERSAEGTYDDKGEKIGVWKYYLNTSELKTVENYATGEVTAFYPDGSKRQHFFLKNDVIEGEVELYHPCGGLREKLIYKAGKRNGKGESFYPNGKTDMVYEYTDDKATGVFIGYYSNGQIYNKSPYKNDLLDGTYEEYYANGKLKTKGTYINNKSDGVWNYYYINGRLEKSGTFKAGNAVGEWTFYDTHGNISEKRNLNAEGVYRGDNTFYSDGKIASIQTYKNDLLVKLVYLNKDGKELTKAESGSGTFTAKTFYPTGHLNGEGSYKKGKAEGVWRYYQPEGRKLSEYTYVNGLIQGEGTEYHRNGQKKFSFQYKDGNYHGYYQEFYPNGKVKEEGWMQDGQRQQQWLSYYADGVLESDAYYLNDELTGEYYEYNNDGNLGAVTVFEGGRVEDMKVYDLKGNLKTKQRADGNKKIVETFHTTKKLQSQFVLLCGNYIDNQTKWFPDGNILLTYNMMSGKRHGTYQYKYMNDQLEIDGQYVNGSPEGQWKGYYSNGQLDYMGKYVQGNHDSTWTFYYMHGKISSTISFLKDERHGIARFNSPEGIPVLEKLYHEGDLVAFRAANTKSEFGEWVPFTGNEVIKAIHPNGTTAIEEPYKNGTMNGAKRIYFSNGKLYSEYNYKDGDYEGAFKVFYPSGQLREKGEYKDDGLDGINEEYYEDGKLLKQETYTRGARNGRAVVNKKDGKSKVMNFWWGIPE